ncbi:hypothetical protein KQX54_008820 [Cotesia glomerata]|uniref:Uncharacterized protein n=1 Tax=Cotesia glomerata TaxID=32391 RepID=A0AAV7I2E8_COTGL|nr:hypothetical protein KQX54_008820 [Cotesia glomerata]
MICSIKKLSPDSNPGTGNSKVRAELPVGSVPLKGIEKGSKISKIYSGTLYKRKLQCALYIHILCIHRMERRAHRIEREDRSSGKGMLRFGEKQGFKGRKYARFSICSGSGV